MRQRVERRRRRIGELHEECSVCGHNGLQLMESWRTRQLPRFWEGRHLRRYGLCPYCGARIPTEPGLSNP